MRRREKANRSATLPWSALCGSLIGAAAIMGYWREPRTFRSDPPVTAALERLRFMPVPVAGAPPEVYFALGRPFENGAYDLSQGKRLYSWFG